MLTRKIDNVIDTFYDNTKMALMLKGSSPKVRVR